MQNYIHKHQSHNIGLGTASYHEIEKDIGNMNLSKPWEKARSFFTEELK